MPSSIAKDFFTEAENLKEKGASLKAVEAYKKAIEADPSFISAYYNLAVIYHRTQQFHYAITCLKKAIELDPGDASVFNNLGVLYFTINVFDEAKKYFEKSLSIESDYKEAKNNLEKVQQELKKSASRPLSQQVIESHHHKIGFVSLWYERGQAYVTKAIKDALDNQYNTFIFARNGGTSDNPLLQTTGEWNVPNLTVYPEYRIPREVLKNWVVQNDLKVVFFNEEYDLGLVEVVKQCGVKTVGYYVWELFDPQYVTSCKSLYDKIICPTKACYEKFKNLGMDNVEYIRWGVELNLFKPQERPENKRVRFFHPAGWGGLHARRGTQFVLDAFQKLNVSNAELLIHTQHGSGVQESDNIKIIYGTVPREEIIRLYQESDVAVLPSKWEGLGLTFLESIGCGLPIISVDAPPMNEFVRNGETGFLCRVAERRNYEGIHVEGVHVDVDDMAEKMKIMLDRNYRATMGKNVRILAEEFSFRQFKENIQNVFLDVIGRTNRCLRLNLGCGTDIKQGYINIDQRQIGGVDIIADVSRLPFPNESVSEILANDIVEHFPRVKTTGILYEWARILKEDGVLRIQCPDLKALSYAYSTNQIPVEEFARRLYGGQDYGGNFHYTGFDLEYLTTLLIRTGISEFRDIKFYNYNLFLSGIKKSTLPNKKFLNIVCVGNTSGYHTEAYIRKSLVRLGHRVHTFDYRAIAKAVGAEAMNNMFINFVAMVKPDFILIAKGEIISPKTVRKIKNAMQVKIATWYPDQSGRCENWIVELNRETDFYFQTTGWEQQLKDYERLGVKNARWLMQGVDPEIYRHVELSERKRQYYGSDVAFIGSLLEGHDKRTELLLKIHASGVNFKIWGPNGHWPINLPFQGKAVYEEDFSKVCSSSKIVVCNHSMDCHEGIPLYFSIKYFLTMACGAFTLVKYSAGLEQVFENHKHLVWFHTPEEAVQLIQYYLQNPEKRKQIATDGQCEVYKKHTYDHRIRCMLDTVFPALSDGLQVSEKSDWEKEYDHDFHRVSRERHYATTELNNRLFPLLWRLEFLVKNVKMHGRILEVGCIDGIFSLRLGMEGFDVTGVDVSSEAIKQAERYRDELKLKKVTFLQSFGETLPIPDHSFDFIFANQILEHVQDLPVFLEEIRRVMKTHGVFMGTVPFQRNYYDPHHLHFFSEDNLKEMLSRHFDEVAIYRLYEEPENDNMMILLFSAGYYDFVQLQRSIYEYTDSLKKSHGCLTSGLNLLKAGETDKAIAAFEQACNHSEFNFRAHYLSGICQLHKRNLSEALKQLNNAIKIKPRFAEAHLQLANVLCELNDLEKAKVHFNRCIELSPGTQESKFAKKKIMAIDGKSTAGISSSFGA